jgi:diguanylate cyclase (GGDEF)-like protein
MDLDGLAVALLRKDGKVLHFNRALAGLAENPAKLLEPVPEGKGVDGDCVYQGKVVVGSGDGRKTACQGRIYRQGDGLLLVCEAGHASDEQLLEENRVLRERLDALTRQDILTGLANRKQLDRRIDEEIMRWERYHRPLSLVLADLDHFGAINARYGRAAADEALLHVGTILRQSIRSLDLAARYGGEEFAVLLPETNDMGALIVAERLRLDLESQILLPLLEPITASFGVATLIPGEKREPFFARALAALRRAKEQGRNRVTVAETAATL